MLQLDIWSLLVASLISLKEDLHIVIRKITDGYAVLKSYLK